MKVKVSLQLRLICEEIVAMNIDEESWAEMESGDMFQEEGIIGGYDGDDRAFFFELWGLGGDIWVRLTLDEAGEVASGRSFQLPIAPSIEE